MDRTERPPSHEGMLRLNLDRRGYERWNGERWAPYTVPSVDTLRRGLTDPSGGCR